ncbi:immunity protein Imm33 domain-containing protein [Pseudomonas yamanorum]|uniref:immunity protein Imm33 domain-containing protein n=1 Tax=Pseudomonas yamanorum TaxID=515393 RepID=UPI003F74B8C0
MILSHIPEWASLILPYLGLPPPPGWRFLVTEKYEDAWKAPQLIGTNSAKTGLSPLK